VLNTLAITAASFSKETSFRDFFKDGTIFHSCKQQIISGRLRQDKPSKELTVQSDTHKVVQAVNQGILLNFLLGNLVEIRNVRNFAYWWTYTMDPIAYKITTPIACYLGQQRLVFLLQLCIPIFKFLNLSNKLALRYKALLCIPS
jgi:hypothetical protein